LNNGQNAYQVDIKSTELPKNSYSQSGSVVFHLNNTNDISVVPSWLISDKQFIWIKDASGFTKKTVVVGKTFGDQTQIVSGLNSDDQIVTNPEVIIKKNYLIF
jgi:hypothetical protein